MVSELDRLKEENQNMRRAHSETNNELVYYKRINSDLNEQIIAKNIRIAELKIRLNKPPKKMKQS